MYVCVCMFIVSCMAFVNECAVNKENMYILFFSIMNASFTNDVKLHCIKKNQGYSTLYQALQRSLYASAHMSVFIYVRHSF